jgi:hypothetical protein
MFFFNISQLKEMPVQVFRNTSIAISQVVTFLHSSHQNSVTEFVAILILI